MDAKRLPDTIHDGYIRLTLAKGVLLVLPVRVYREGLRKGKAERRAARLMQRLARATTGSWVTGSGLCGPEVANRSKADYWPDTGEAK